MLSDDCVSIVSYVKYADILGTYLRVDSKRDQFESNKQLPMYDIGLERKYSLFSNDLVIIIKKLFSI